MKKIPEETIHIHHMEENGCTYFQKEYTYFQRKIHLQSRSVFQPATLVYLGVSHLKKYPMGFINIHRENGWKTLRMDGTLAV